MHHVAVHTDRFEDAYRFYTELLGLAVVKPPFDFAGKRTIAWIDAGNTMVELCSLKKGESAAAHLGNCVGAAHLAFECDDIHELVGRLETHGVVVRKPPFLPNTGDPRQPLVAFVLGPDGDEIELRERTTRGGE